MKRNVYDLSGKVKEEVSLPEIFEEEFRPDLIKRASLSLRSHSYQPKGNMPRAGLQTSADFFGRRHAYRSMNATATVKVPRIKEPKGRMGAARKVPQAVGGTRAHGPSIYKTLSEKINNKERKKAIKSALACTADKELVKKRGHKFEADVPLIIVDEFNSIKKTKEAKDVLIKLKLENELKRGEQKKVRAGKGKARSGKRYRKRKSVLIVVDEDKGILKAAKSIPGIDVCLAKNINADLLAPGGDAGRITLFTKTALNNFEKMFA